MKLLLWLKLNVALFQCWIVKNRWGAHRGSKYVIINYGKVFPKHIFTNLKDV